MRNLWQHVREFIPMAAIIVLCLAVVPSAQADPETASSTGANATTATQQQTSNTQGTAVVAPDNANPAKAKPKTATKPVSKSVLDAEVLDSPISYFKDAFSSEENDAAATPSAGALVMTVKVLIATLLSTIM